MFWTGNTFLGQNLIQNSKFSVSAKICYEDYFESAEFDGDAKYPENPFFGKFGSKNSKLFV